MGATEHNEPLKVVFEKKDEVIELALKATPDKIKLFIDAKVIAPEETPVHFSREQLEALFPHNLHRAFFHTAILDAVALELSQRKVVSERRISKGRASDEGRDGKVVFLVKRYQAPGGGKDIEWVDSHFIRMFDNLEKGAIVARLYAPTPGSDGQDVFGQPIKSRPGKPAKISLEKNLTLHPAEPGHGYETIVAEVAGFLTESSGKLVMKEELAINGNVDIKCGDVDFIGSVRVTGDVMKDFRITARKDVIVGGSTNHASILSSQGSITIAGAAVGSQIRVTNAPDHGTADPTRSLAKFHGAEYRAAGTFQSTTAQGVSVEAHGDIAIKREASGCSLRSRGLLWMPQGHLFGGEVYVVCGVEAKIIGSRMGSETKLFLCSDVESSLEYSEVMFQIREAQQVLELLHLHLGPYAENPSRLVLLKEPLQSKQKKLYAKLKSVEATLLTLEQKRLELLKGASHNPTLRVNFHEWLYPGVQIIVDKHIFTTDRELHGPGTVEFLPDVEKFVIREMKPLQCSVERPMVPNQEKK